MATLEREYDFEGSTFDFGGDSPPLDGSGGEEDGGSGCIGHLLWALAIYGVAIVLAIVLPGAGDFWGMVIGTEGEGVNWVQESADVRLLVFGISCCSRRPVGGALSFRSGWDVSDHDRLVGIARRRLGAALPQLVHGQQRWDVLVPVGCDSRSLFRF